jgi:hypothetical protein
MLRVANDAALFVHVAADTKWRRRPVQYKFVPPDYDRADRNFYVVEDGELVRKFRESLEAAGAEVAPDRICICEEVF